MSDNIYDDVISNGSAGTDGERVEMTVDIYESADFVKDQGFRTNTQRLLQQTGSDLVRIRSSRATVCLVLLCVFQMIAIILLCVHIYSNNTQDINKILTNITNLTKERDQLQKKNKDGWFNYQSSFYFISSEDKSWSESRRYCRDRGADLIIINSREEQDILNNISDRTAVWIGLTGCGKNGIWKWVDDSNMTTRLWNHGEPNEAEGEICAVSRSSGWSDYKCHYPFQWICEKSSSKCH